MTTKQSNINDPKNQTERAFNHYEIVTEDDTVLMHITSDGIVTADELDDLDRAYQSINGPAHLEDARNGKFDREVAR